MSPLIVAMLIFLYNAIFDIDTNSAVHHTDRCCSWIMIPGYGSLLLNYYMTVAFITTHMMGMAVILPAALPLLLIAATQAALCVHKKPANLSL